MPKDPFSDNTSATPTADKIALAPLFLPQNLGVRQGSNLSPQVLYLLQEAVAGSEYE